MHVGSQSFYSLSCKCTGLYSVIIANQVQSGSCGSIFWNGLIRLPGAQETGSKAQVEIQRRVTEVVLKIHGQ